jgi:colanic acid/amylovoran biosynthesis protein
MSGMGGITDAYRQYAFGVLDTLGLAIQHGIPTAMFGQGIGPIQDAKLMARAREILPYVDLIALREGRVGRPLLDSLGVSSSRILTTGDDAIELAYQPLPVGLGKALGVNVRASRCSEVDRGLIDQIRVVLQSAAKAQKAPMIPVPISRVPREDDAVTIQRLIAGYNQVSGSVSDPDTFSKVIEQIRDCRVVVTGSYHAGVFALAQGIPVVGLAKSDYYRDKFLGLADQFGTGCESVFLTDPQWPGTLAAAIDKMWQLAEQARPQLLDAARRQVELSRAAYQHFRELISSQVRRGHIRRRARPGWH